MLVGSADRRTWRHNLRQPADVDLWAAGEHLRARAVVVEGSTDPGQAAAGLSAYCRALPRAATTDVGTAILVRADIVRGA